MVNPITKEKFAETMQGFIAENNSPLKVAVAVSGGGDSIALAILLNEWIKDNGGELIALTVDHNLRSESSSEAVSVGKNLGALGIKHKVLTWEGDKPCTHIQELAREARYKLLMKECKAQGYNFLAVAHNLEDQAETFWMRLSHGSGLDGLSSMADIRDVNGLKIIRPVMSFTRDALRLTCKDRDVEWIEDPSNHNKKYLRVKLREFEALLIEEGMTPDRVVKSIQKLDDAKQALQSIACDYMNECVKVYPSGYASLKLSLWNTYPKDIQRRILSEVLNIIYPQIYRLGFEKQENTRQELIKADFSGKTVFGCELVPSKSGDVLFLREESKVGVASLVSDNFIWDKRFLITGIKDESLKVNILGDDGLSQLRKDNFDNKEFYDLQFKVKRVFPAIWKDDELLAVPHIGYYNASCGNSLKEIEVKFINLREGFCREQRA